MDGMGWRVRAGVWCGVALVMGGCTSSTVIDDSSKPKHDAGMHATHNTEDGGAEVDAGGRGHADAGVADSGEPPVEYPELDPGAIGDPVQVASGFTLAEGPLWDPCSEQLLFTDVTASVVHTLDASGKVGVFMEDTNNANGIAFDIDGSLILAQMGGAPGHVARRNLDGTVDLIEPLGAPLHTPDDVVVRSDGIIYFSDGNFPPIGPLDFSALPVYGLAPGSTELINGGTVVGPNGIELSPDERVLYVDAYYESSVVRFDVAEDGSLTKGTTVAAGLPAPDSLCLDAAGNLYVGISGGLQVLQPDGTPVTIIAVPSAQGVTNCTFGGEDGTTLYITAWTTVWKVDDMPIPGLDFQNSQKRVRCD